MNLKKSLVSLVAAVAISISVASPIVLADSSQTAEVTATEKGDFGYSMVFSSVSFSGAVDTNEGVQLVSNRNEIKYFDNHAYNEEGWTLSIKMDPFTTTGGYEIDNKYMSIRIRAGQGDLCTNDGNPLLPVEGKNTYQTITSTVPTGTETGGVSLEEDVVLLNASTGRGCGADSISLRYTLDLPAGTYTGGKNAIYSTSIVLTEMASDGVGEGEVQGD